MPFRTKLDFSSNRQIKQFPANITQLSGGTSFGVPFSALTTGPDLTTSAITNSYPLVSSSYSGNSGTTNFTWGVPEMSLGESQLSALTPSNSATTQNVLIFTAATTTVIDGNTIALTYTGVTYPLVVVTMDDLGGGDYSGTLLTNTVSLLSASTLDYTGRTIWVDVSGITRTNELIVTRNPQVGYVLTCVDTEGKLELQPSSGGTGSTSVSIWTASTGTPSAVLSGGSSLASGDYAVAEGNATIASGNWSHAEGLGTIAGGPAAHAEGAITTALGDYSHSEGLSTTTLGLAAHAEGISTKVLGDGAHAEGYQTTATSDYGSHAEGSGTTAYNFAAHAEGAGSIAGGLASHAEGTWTIASASGSHAQGGFTQAAGDHSHAGGLSSVVSGNTSFGHGRSVTVNGDYSVVIGGTGNTVTALAINSGIFCGSANTINASVRNTAIIAGSGITATLNDMVYVPDLIIDGLTNTDPIATDANGKIVAGTSDARLKQNIQQLNNSLEIIKNLRGVSFEYTQASNMGGGTRYGFIAQEVQNIVPTIVRDRAKSDGMLSLNYTEIVPLLVEAVKELSTGATTQGGVYLETQSILAEDNDIQLNYSGNQQTAIGGGIRVLHALGQDKEAEFITDENGNWITNNDIKAKALTIPLYTPTSSSDVAGKEGNITRDDDYIYIKTNSKWKRTKLEEF
jgi:hypothetical protein